MPATSSVCVAGGVKRGEIVLLSYISRNRKSHAIRPLALRRVSDRNLATFGREAVERQLVRGVAADSG